MDQLQKMMYPQDLPAKQGGSPTPARAASEPPSGFDSPERQRVRQLLGSREQVQAGILAVGKTGALDLDSAMRRLKVTDARPGDAANARPSDTALGVMLRRDRRVGLGGVLNERDEAERILGPEDQSGLGAGQPTAGSTGLGAGSVPPFATAPGDAARAMGMRTTGVDDLPEGVLEHGGRDW